REKREERGENNTKSLKDFKIIDKNTMAIGNTIPSINAKSLSMLKGFRLNLKQTKCTRIQDKKRYPLFKNKTNLDCIRGRKAGIPVNSTSHVAFAGLYFIIRSET